MSDDWVIFVPADHLHVPPIETHELARQFVAERFPEADEVTIDVSTDPEVVDPGKTSKESDARAAMQSSPSDGPTKRWITPTQPGSTTWRPRCPAAVGSAH
jgi:hypothetical protein